MEFFKTRIWRKKNPIWAPSTTKLLLCTNTLTLVIVKYDVILFSPWWCPKQNYIYRRDERTLFITMFHCYVNFQIELLIWSLIYKTKQKSYMTFFSISTTVILLYCLTCVDGLIRYEWLSSVRILYRASSIWLVMVFIVTCNTIVF